MFHDYGLVGRFVVEDVSLFTAALDVIRVPFCINTDAYMFGIYKLTNIVKGYYEFYFKLNVFYLI